MIIDQPLVEIIAKELNEKLHFAFPNFSDNPNTLANMIIFMFDYIKNEYDLDPMPILLKTNLEVYNNVNDFNLKSIPYFQNTNQNWGDKLWTMN